MPHPSLFPLIFRVELRDSDSDSSISQWIEFTAPSAGPFTQEILTCDLKTLRGKRIFQPVTISEYQTILDKDMDLSEDKLSFICGNPRVETIEGIIHLYKRKSPSNEPCKTSLLCIISVPAFITVKDLINFTAPMKHTIEQMKVVKNDMPNQYMVLLKLIDNESAHEFYNRFNNKTFNSIEAEVCQLVYVEKVEALSASSGACFPLQNYIELPTCTVCIERLDEPLRDVLTILCNHSFHGSCVSKMDESICPVCRYMQTPEQMGEHVCAKCDLQENLWICIICGHVGCGRYGQKHAHEHFEETGHVFALEIGKNQVWDYAEDSYVHRLVATDASGKPVQVGGSVDDQVDKKTNVLHLEYADMLISCLDSQRMHFEERLADMDRMYSTKVNQLQEEVSTATMQLENLQQKVDLLSREKQVCEKKVSSLTNSLNKTEKSLQDEKALNTSLTSNQQEWQKKYSDLLTRYQTDSKSKDSLIKDLQEQVTDLMLNFDMKNKLTAHEISSEELAGSQMLVTESPASSSTPPRLSVAAMREKRKKKN